MIRSITIRKIGTTVCLIVIFHANVFSQNVGINSTGAIPDVTAILDVDATNKGILIPRVSLTVTTNPFPVSAPTTSLLVYNTAIVNDVIMGYYYWDGMKWVRLMTNESNDWRLSGNTGTTVGANFIGTADLEGLAFKTNNVDRMRIHENSPYVSIGHVTPEFALDVRGVNATTSALEMERYSNNAFGGYFNFYKSRGTNINDNGVLSDGDYLGTIRAYADDGVGSSLGAEMEFIARGANAETDLNFNLNDGSGTLLPRLIIEHTGAFGFNSSFTANGTDYSVYSSGETGTTEFSLFSYGNGSDSGVELTLASGQGTKSSHSASMSGDLLGSINFSGYVLPSQFRTSATISVNSTDNYTGGSTLGSEMLFFTTESGTDSFNERMRITDNGKIGFNTSSLGSNYNGDFHFMSNNTSTAEMVLAAGNTGSGSDAIIHLAEDHDNTFSVNLVYDGGLNELQIEGKNGATTYPNLVTIERNTGNTNFAGNLSVTGNLSKGGGTFKIDHPQDPENKYLYHSFVESPDMMNIYNGNITTNENGEKLVQLPEYFESLNMEFRYQLTVIGTFAQAIISKVIKGNTFVIKTNLPNIQVSWQVTGVRKDAWANENRVVTVVEKEEWEKGFYLHPKAHGQVAEKAMNLAPVPDKTEDNDPEAIINEKTEDNHQEAIISEKKITEVEELNGGI